MRPRVSRTARHRDEEELVSKEDERKRKETENATDVIGELFGKVLELVKGTSGEKDEEKG